MTSSLSHASLRPASPPYASPTRQRSPSPSVPPFGMRNASIAVPPRSIFAPSSPSLSSMFSSQQLHQRGRGGSAGGCEGALGGIAVSSMGSSYRTPSVNEAAASATTTAATAAPRWRPRVHEAVRQPSLQRDAPSYHHRGASTSERWHPTMTHVPTRVLDAPGMVDDAYSQCLSWGRHRMAAILDGQVLLFDVSNPKLFTGFKHTEEDDEAGAVGLGGVASLPKSRLSAVAVSARTDEECLVGDSRGRVRILADRGDQSDAVVTRVIALEADISAELGGTGIVKNHDHQHQFFQPLQRLHASALTMHMPLLFDMATRSVSSIDAIDRHPFLYLVGTAAGSTIVLDTRIPGQGVVAARANGDALCGAGGPGLRHRPSSTQSAPHYLPPDANRCTAAAAAYPSPSNVVPCLADRVLAVSWNCSGSLMAVGTNACGVAVWSLANMSEPVHRIGVGSGIGGDGGSAAASASTAAVRALCFHPSDPFELAYGGGLGDGSLCLSNVATSERLYASATGAQVTQLRYSPCGSMLVSAHGLRKADMPRMSAFNAGTGGGGLEWGGAPDGPCSRRKNCIAVWSRGRTKATPSSVLARTVSGAQADAMGGDAYGPSRHTSSALMTRSSSRDSINSDSSSVNSEADSMDSMSGCCMDDGGWTTPDHDTGAQGNGPRPLQLRVRLDGHTTRPLHMAVPRDGPHLGGVATAAGGVDSTIRNWDVFSRTRRGTTTSGRSSMFTTTPQTAASSPSPSMEVFPQQDTPTEMDHHGLASRNMPPSPYAAASYRSALLPQQQPSSEFEYSSSMHTGSLR